MAIQILPKYGFSCKLIFPNVCRLQDHAPNSKTSERGCK